jgi:hypothetical protein
MGAMGSNDQAKKQYNLELMQYYEEQKQRREQMLEAQRQREETHLGATDAKGNRTHFVPGVGWVSELSDTSKSISDAQDKEQLATLTHDLPMRRAQLDKNAERQGAEGIAADGLLEQFRRQSIQRTDPQTIERMLYAAKSRGVNEAADGAQNAASRQAIRSGTSNTGAILASLSRERNKALGEAAEDAKIASWDYDPGAKKKNDLLQQYGMMASRASQMPGVSYAPTNVAASPDALMSAFSSKGQGDDATINNILASKAPQIPTHVPDPTSGWGSALVTGGNALQSAFQSIDPNRLRKNSGNGDLF